MELYSLKDIAEMLDVKPYKITYLISCKIIPDTVKIGGKRVWTAEQVDELRRDLYAYEKRRGKKEVENDDDG
jgi:DNA-binding transcriptional MerR regulator